MRDSVTGFTRIASPFLLNSLYWHTPATQVLLRAVESMVVKYIEIQKFLAVFTFSLQFFAWFSRF